MLRKHGQADVLAPADNCPKHRLDIHNGVGESGS